MRGSRLRRRRPTSTPAALRLRRSTPQDGRPRPTRSDSSVDATGPVRSCVPRDPQRPETLPGGPAKLRTDPAVRIRKRFQAGRRSAWRFQDSTILALRVAQRAKPVALERRGRKASKRQSPVRRRRARRPRRSCSALALDLADGSTRPAPVRGRRRRPRIGLDASRASDRARRSRRRAAGGVRQCRHGEGEGAGRDFAHVRGGVELVLRQLAAHINMRVRAVEVGEIEVEGLDGFAHG